MMGRYALIRAAEQMARDGIRSIGPGKRCGHERPVEGAVFGCKNRARYFVEGVGVRCFTHASAFIGRAALPPLKSDPIL